MLKTIIKKDSYQDSVSLMLLSTKVQKLEGVTRATVMMATEANHAMFAAAGLLTDEVKAASPNDMAIVIEAESEEIFQSTLAEVEKLLAGGGKKGAASNEGFETVRSFEAAAKELAGANIAMISVPGAFAAGEARKALDAGLHVFMFSDNVSLADEVALKTLAVEKGLLMMGPDCGTAVLAGVPLGFANVLRRGKIGIVGASGTGIQEVACLIDRTGEGISHAIGTGGRDLSKEVQGRTARLAVQALIADAATEVLVVISKPPAKEVEELLLADLRQAGKPVVVMFLGSERTGTEGNITFTNSLIGAAEAAVAVARGEQIKPATFAPAPAATPTGTLVKGLFTGGTLAGEAAQILAELLPGEGGADHHEDGVFFQRDGHQIIDFGDDVYTRGRAHPMIDPRTRNEAIVNAAQDPTTGVILLDVVIGYGAHPDPATGLVETLASVGELKVPVIASVTGTEGDPQKFAAQRTILESAGIIVASSNAEAATWAAQIVVK
ncbi:MAG TPA: acyl-CoA synthetase FdrA [Symbiobacteriaceae bacterium]|nr:acyl-CoA synthetase FdrA [Symbiobacteriaceae bacterium]